MNLDSILSFVMSWVLTYSPKILFALLTLFVGLFVIKGIQKVLQKSMKLKNVDITLSSFLASIISMGLKIVLLISVISMVGVQMTSFVALLGAAGLAVGLSLQGSLSNFAGGALLMFFRPFKVGDYVEANGFSGTVKEIQIFNTILNTPDNKTIIIPNGSLSNGNIVNYSTEATRRVDFKFGIGYSDDLEKAKKLIKDITDKDTRIFIDPPPKIRLIELGDSSVNIVVRVWAATKDYWDIYFDMMENVKLAFDENNMHSVPATRCSPLQS